MDGVIFVNDFDIMYVRDRSELFFVMTTLENKLISFTIKEQDDILIQSIFDQLDSQDSKNIYLKINELKFVISDELANAFHASLMEALLEKDQLIEEKRHSNTYH